jgi:hypothetical protein
MAGIPLAAVNGDKWSLNSAVIPVVILDCPDDIGVLSQEINKLN